MIDWDIDMAYSVAEKIPSQMSGFEWKWPAWSTSLSLILVNLISESQHSSPDSCARHMSTSDRGIMGATAIYRLPHSECGRTITAPILGSDFERGGHAPVCCHLRPAIVMSAPFAFSYQGRSKSAMMVVCLLGLMVVIKLDGAPQLCKTDEVGELCVSSGCCGTGYWGLPGVSNSVFRVCLIFFDSSIIGYQYSFLVSVRP